MIFDQDNLDNPLINDKGSTNVSHTFDDAQNYDGPQTYSKKSRGSNKNYNVNPTPFGSEISGTFNTKTSSKKFNYSNKDS